MTPPKIDNAPGLKWRKINAGWQAIWRARTDIVRRGYAFKSTTLWFSTKENPECDEISKEFIADRCRALQDEMHIWASGGILEMAAYDRTWGSLVRAYQSDPDSPYLEKRFATRGHYDTLCRRIEKDCGADRIADTDARKLKRLHEGWSDNGNKVSMGHAMIGMLRTITTFGATLLKCPDCKAIRSDLHDMRVKNGAAREQHLSAEQVVLIRAHAHTMKRPYRHSIALAQALQFDGTMRQKDIIGEWVPLNEPGPLSDVISGNAKWVRGIRCEEIDDNLILRHVTSKKDKLLTLDLKLCPMVLDELRLMAGLGPNAQLQRGHIPASGPLIVNEQTGVPWTAHNFRVAWRAVARACGVPDGVRNMDTRSGAITEALAAGAPMDAVRKSATHSSASMTQRYSRGDQEAVSSVLQHRAAHRNKDGTK
jgi:hypothetical protein